MPIQWGRTYSNFSMGTIKFDFIFDILLFFILYYAKLYLVFHNRLYHINHNMDLLSISEINWDFWIDTIIYSLILLKNCVADLLLLPICIHGLSTKGARIWLSILLVDSRCDFFCLHRSHFCTWADPNVRVDSFWPSKTVAFSVYVVRERRAVGWHSKRDPVMFYILLP